MSTKEEGFTLIELLVVVIIIGILAAIGIPTLLSTANKARGAEARNNVGVINRAQAAHFVAESEFADDLAALNIGIPDATDNYTYAVTAAEANASVSATPNNDQLYGYSGAVEIDNNQTLSGLCESDDPGDTPAAPAGAAGAMACPGGSEAVK